jgi:hypothetical protein
MDQNPKNNVYDNAIVLCHNCHTRYHNGKGISSEQIRARKRHLIAKTITIWGLNALKIAERNGEGVVAMPFLLYHMVNLGYMAKREQQMGYGTIEATARFEITARGRALLVEWFSD